MLLEAQYNLLHPGWLDITQFNIILLFKKSIFIPLLKVESEF